MRSILLFLLFITSLASCVPAKWFGDNSKIYLVRHAEKASGKDPLLTDEGNKRAGNLLRFLKDSGIRRIYVTEYKRTQNTGDSLRIQSGINTVHYSSDTTYTDLLSKLKANHDLDKPILIIGHSNTIPLMIRKLGIPSYPTQNIPDNEFDNLFLLTFRKGTATLKKMKYGAASGKSALMQ